MAPLNVNEVADPTVACPGDLELLNLLQGQVSDSEEVALVGHLDTCRRCHGRLQRQAATDSQWSKVAENLRASRAEGQQDTERILAQLETRIQRELCPMPDRRGEDRLELPDRVGPYAILDVLGRGGMGVVFKAEDPSLGRVVAIKVLDSTRGYHEEACARFRREARAAAAVRSDHTVTVYGVEDEAEPPYFVMEYVPGVTLQDRIDRESPLELDEILRIGAETSRGLAALHAAGLVHRDIKPANTLLEEGTGRVKITDFGLARAIDDAGITSAGSVTGTPAYMAPEQCTGQSVDYRADLFSLGSVLYAMCTGRPPFQAESSLAVLRRTCEEEAPPIHTLRGDIPQSLVDLVERLHRKDPAARFDSADEVADTLELLRTRPDATLPEAKRCRLPAAVGRRRKRLGWFAAATVLVAALTLSGAEMAGITNLHEPASPAAGGGGAMGVADENEPVQLRPIARLEGHKGPVFSVAYSRDGKRAVSCSGRPQGDRTIRVWDVAAGEEVQRLNAEQIPDLPTPDKWKNPTGEFYAVTFSRDGNQVLFAGANGLAGLWDLKTDSVVRRFVGHTGSVEAIAVSPDGKRVLTGAQDASLRLWDFATGKELQRMEGHDRLVRAVAFSPDGKQALSGSEDHTMRLWDLGIGQQAADPFKCHPGYTVFNVAFAPDGRQAVSCGRTIKLWNLRDGRVLREFKGHEVGPPIVQVVFSPDGRRLLSCGNDKTLRLWDFKTGRELATLVGHWNWVVSVAFSPDGRHALSGAGGTTVARQWTGGTDFAIRLWELPE